MVGYDINNINGNSCPILNFFDGILLLGYLFLVIFTLWKNGIDTLPYIATLILSLRALFKFWIRHRKIKSKSNSNNVAIVHIISITIYLFLTFVMAAFYFMSNDATSTKVILTIYYVIYALFEFTEILAKCYDAEPHLYGK